MNIAVVGTGFVGSNIIERLKDKHKVFEFIRGDKLDFEFINTVILVACDADSRNSNANFPSSVEDNTGIFTKVLDAAIKYNVRRLIYISSIEAENEYNVYAICKATNEKILRLVAPEHEMEYVILRPCNLYGKYMDIHNPKRNVVANFLQAIKEKKRLPIQNGEASYPFTYVGVLVDNVVDSLVNNTNETVRIGSNLQIPIYDMANLLEGITTTWDWVKEQ